MWFTKEVATTVKAKKMAFRNYKQSHSNDDREVYFTKQKEAKKVIRAAKAQTEEKLAHLVQKGDKSFFRYINERRKTKEGIVRLKTASGILIESERAMADHLNKYFCSIFTKEREGKGPLLNGKTINTVGAITTTFTEEQVLKELSKLKVDKSMGPDGIHPRILKELRGVLAKPLTELFNQSLITGVIPEDWKIANVVPLHKSGSREEASNYRPVSLTSVVGKLMETLLKEQIVQYLKSSNLQDPKQHGFTGGRSCQTNLIEFFDWVSKVLDKGGAVDIAYLDFSKAFDTVPHRRLLNKLETLGLDLKLVAWIQSWLQDRQQRVVVNGISSGDGKVTSGVPQGSVLGPVLFNIFIGDIACGIEGKICLFADDTKICNRVDTPGGLQKMRDDLGRLEEWSRVWQLQFNGKKCKIMHLGHKNPKAQYFLNGITLESTEEERDLGVIISSDLKVANQCNKAMRKASQMLGCIGRGISSRKREVVMPLYKSLVRPHLEYCVQFWRPYLQKDINTLETVQRRATKMVHGLCNKSYQERLEELNMYSLEQRRERGDMIAAFKYIKGCDQLEEGTIFQKKRCNRTRGHEYKLEGGRFKGNVRKNYFTERVIDKWNILPSEVVEANTVEQFKHAWDKYKGILN